MIRVNEPMKTLTACIPGSAMRAFVARPSRKCVRKGRVRNASEEHQQVFAVASAISKYLQSQDDRIDCFAPPEHLGKVGTDIVDNTHSWCTIPPWSWRLQSTGGWLPMTAVDVKTPMQKRKRRQKRYVRHLTPILRPNLRSMRLKRTNRSCHDECGTRCRGER